MTRSDAMISAGSGREVQVKDCVRTYDRIAPVYDLLDAFYERGWKRRLRADLFRHARGLRLLDVGIGTGCNMPFYPPGAEVIGVDTSPAMLARARERAQELGRKVGLYEMNLLDLQFPDASFDTVVTTFVLLCLPDELQGPALQELRRVTRPNGQILILDYRLAENKGVRLWMRMLSPWLKWAFFARYDPRTEEFIESSGLEVTERQSSMGDGVTMLVLRPRRRHREASGRRAVRDRARA